MGFEKEVGVSDKREGGEVEGRRKEVSAACTGAECLSL